MTIIGTLEVNGSMNLNLQFNCVNNENYTEETVSGGIGPTLDKGIIPYSSQ